MSPDFRELVGDEGTPEELARLRRVHELLVQAGPPPELPPELEQAPPAPSAKPLSLPRRRPATALGIAAAAALAAFVIGYAVGGRGSEFDTAFSVPMHGVGQVSAARAEVKVGAKDKAGNWPVVFTVRGLPRLEPGAWYELYLTRKGTIKESCGTFTVAGPSPQTTVKLNVPYSLKGYSGWVVTEHIPGMPNSDSRFVMRTNRV